MNEQSTVIEDFTEIFQVKQRKIDNFIIRIADIAISFSTLLVLSPILFLVALIIRIDSPGSPIFKQKRAGENGAIFTIYKFRTMCVDAEKLQKFRNTDEPVVKIQNDRRITRIGAILRKLSIDEFPQFINVLKGDISVVGPRPVVLDEYNAYNEYQKYRLAGKPGITGLAQINGRSDLDFDTIVKYDIYYNRNRSVYLYFKLLFKTIPYCLFGKSSY